jgi:GAF domain-containing protein
MNRERQLAQAFVVLADTYAVGFDPLHLFHCLVHACRDLLDVDAAAVMIADARGTLRTMATTDEDAAFAELLQLQNGQGPCMDCYRTGEPVSVPDIAAEYGRWPKLATAMIESDYGSLQAIPVSLHARPLGALTLLRRSPGRLAEDDVHLAQALADSAALALMHWSAEPERLDEVITRVQSVIASKATLEIAKGMVAQYAGTTIGEAARLLSAYASGHRVRLTDTAHALVNRGLTLDAVVDTQIPR